MTTANSFPYLLKLIDANLLLSFIYQYLFKFLNCKSGSSKGLTIRLALMIHRIMMWILDPIYKSMLSIDNFPAKHTKKEARSMKLLRTEMNG